MSWTLKRTTNPQKLAVSLDEAKSHLRVAGSDQDDLITQLIESSIEKVERDIERSLISCTWQQSQCGFPDSAGAILLNMAPASSITSIGYVDADGASQTLSTDDYELDLGRNSVTCLNDDDGWADTLSTASNRDTVTVTFVCGSSDPASVPRLFKQAVLMDVGVRYYDPAMENGVNTDNGRSYEAIIRRLIRSSYP